MEVVHPYKYKIEGYDKIGAMLLFNKNRGWWCGSIMDEVDSSSILNYKYGNINIINIRPNCFTSCRRSLRWL